MAIGDLVHRSVHAVAAAANLRDSITWSPSKSTSLSSALEAIVKSIP